MQAEPLEEEKLQPAAQFQSPDEPEERGKPAAAKSEFRFRKPLLAAALVLTCTVAYVEVPRTMWRHNLQLVATFVVRSTHNLLNPQPPVPVQVPTAHESFGQAGDEYKLPAVENIPDATTDPSQISVVPVIDPTVKPPNGASQNNGQGTQSDPTTAAPIDQAQPALAQPAQTQPAQTQPAQVKVEENPGPAQSVPVAQQPLPSHANTPEAVSPGASQPSRSNTADMQAPSAPTAPPVRTSPTHAVPSGPAAAIPGSLRSQLASSTPEASGTKPLEAALPSIGPIDVPEAAARTLLTQQVEPVYPEIARASAQHGTVVLQVTIGRDGAIQDAKFLQGSLVFARSAIDAVKQWRFTPYSFNGRPAPVRTTLTLIFKPSS
jgi:protein TonB